MILGALKTQLSSKSQRLFLSATSTTQKLVDLQSRSFATDAAPTPEELAKNRAEWGQKF
jgi:hypothetical protein